jgi:hypothetical protein
MTNENRKEVVVVGNERVGVAVYLNGALTLSGPDLDIVELLQAIGVKAAFFACEASEIAKRGFHKTLGKYGSLTSLTPLSDEYEIGGTHVKQVWVCDHCGKEYPTKEGAVACEQGHEEDDGDYPDDFSAEIIG